MSDTRINRQTRLLLLILAAVLLLPIYGSWVDFRFAERQPSHKHIYIAKIDPNHHRSSDSKGVVNLPDQDATGQPVVVVFLPGEQIVANSAENNNLSFGLSDEYQSPEDAFLPPPDHPPRI